MRLVAIDAFEFNCHTVDEEAVALDLDGAESNSLRDNFENIAGSVLEGDEQGVEVGIFG